MSVHEAKMGGFMKDNNKLKFTEKLAYGAGTMAEAGSSILAAFLTMFYTDNVGLAAGAVGTMLFISRIFDGITDLIAGSMLDKTKTKWGKARPWLLWLSIPAGLSLALIFMIPQNASSTFKMAYAFITYNLYVSVLFTLVGVAKSALMPLMTQDGLERGALAKWSLIFGLGGTLLGISVTFPFIAKLGGNINAWRAVFGVYGFIVTAGLLFSFFFSKEHIQSVESMQAKGAELKANGKKYNFIDNFKNFFQNKYFIFALVMTVLVNFAVQLNSNSQVYFYTYTMKNPLLTSSLGMVGLIPTVLSIFFLSGPSLRFFGKKKSVYIGCAGQIIGFALRGFASFTMNIPLLIAGTVLCSLSTGPLSVPVNTLSADAVDYGEYLTNRRIEGTGSAIVTFSQKISNGLASGMVGWVLAATGYVANAAQSTATNVGITMLFAWVPLVTLGLVALSFAIFYKYDKEEKMVIEELNRRKAAAMGNVTIENVTKTTDSKASGR